MHDIIYPLYGLDESWRISSHTTSLSPFITSSFPLPPKTAYSGPHCWTHSVAVQCSFYERNDWPPQGQLLGPHKRSGYPLPGSCYGKEILSLRCWCFNFTVVSPKTNTFSLFLPNIGSWVRFTGCVCFRHVSWLCTAEDQHWCKEAKHGGYHTHFPCCSTLEGSWGHSSVIGESFVLFVLPTCGVMWDCLMWWRFICQYHLHWC